MQQEIPLVLGFLLLVFAVLRLGKKSKGHDSTRTPPPGPWKLPLIGNIHQLASSATMPHYLCAHWAKKYGPIMQIQIGEVPTVIISSPDAAKEVLKTQEINFAERPALLVSEIMLYNGQGMSFAKFGDHWKLMRKACIWGLFSATRKLSFRSIREEEVSNLISTIRSKAGSPINLRELLLDLSNEIITRTSIGKKCKNKARFLHTIEQVSKSVGGVNIVDLFPSARLVHMISNMTSSLQRLHEETDQMLEDIINERRASRVEKKAGENKIEAGDDLLDVLLNLQDDGNFKVKTDSIKSIILEMFIGGSETSSTILEWTLAELMKNPSVMDKAQKEVRQVLGNIENVDESSIGNLNFLKLIIKETLRFHPPGPFIPRVCVNSCEVHGYAIEANSKVMVSAWAIGRDPNYWIEPEKFHPERFLDISVDYKGANFEFIPFGSGRRICPGMTFGLANVELALAQLLYHFDWKLPNGVTPEALDMEEHYSSLTRRKHDLILIPVPYRPSSM
ncbi:cytochrome P450 726A27-like [Populus nigra]|uniref:cytochrome P450 726A27-like n=1 Tax=Populus nigra TaxID=3691 RepID=UPI002B268BFD|nr:cytochrome P450 726A27-like [Populus nigra]